MVIFLIVIVINLSSVVKNDMLEVVLSPTAISIHGKQCMSGRNLGHAEEFFFCCCGFSFFLKL